MQRDTRDEDEVYIEAGEAPDARNSFSIDQIANAFAVDPERVKRALRGEFDLGPDARVDSRMAYHLSEVLLGDLPLDEREAVLLQLGGYTPRRDAAWGLGTGPPGEESDRLNAEAGVADDELPSKRSSYAPSTHDAK